MLGPAPALAGVGPRPTRAKRVRGRDVLRFDTGGPWWPQEPTEPIRRPPSRAALFWSRATIVLLVAALLLPFSLAAFIDLVRYLLR